MRFFVGVVVVVVAYGFGGSLGRSAVLSHSRGRDVGMDQKQRVHVLLVVQQLLHILKEFTIIGTGLGSLRLSRCKWTVSGVSSFSRGFTK